MQSGRHDASSQETQDEDTEHGHSHGTGPTPRRVSFWTLLKDRQTALICLSRLADPMASTSMLSYLVFQMRYLSPEASQADLSTHAGIVVSANTLAKVVTSILWGKLADSRGRKGVLLVGLISSAIASACYGFSRTFPMALFWQIVRGAMSCNIAMSRTLIADRYADAGPQVRTRALLLLMLMDGVGMLLGPIIGGFASNPSGLGTIFARYPYALPNLIVAACYASAAVGVSFVVGETLKRDGTAPEDGEGLISTISTMMRRLRGRKPAAYKGIPREDADSIPLTSDVQGADEDDYPVTSLETKPAKPLAFRQIWTTQVICTMLANFIISGHIATFGAVWTVFLSTPIPTGSKANGPGETRPLFEGGMGLSPPEIGIFMTCATVLAVLLQILALPRLSERFGTIRVWRMALWLFPAVYILAPLPAALAVAHQSTAPANAGVSPEPGPYAFVMVVVLVVVFMAGITGASPPLVVFIDDCVPHPSVRGTIHTIGTSVANIGRSIFPVTVLAMYGVGLRWHFVALPFFVLSGLAVVAILAGRRVAENLDPRAVLKKRAGDDTGTDV